MKDCGIAVYPVRIERLQTQNYVEPSGGLQFIQLGLKGVHLFHALWYSVYCSLSS